MKEGTLTVNPDPSANQNQGNQNQGSQNGDNPSSSDDDSTESTVQDSSDAVEKSAVTTNSGMTTAAVKAEAKVSGKEVSAKLSDKGIENAVSLAENTAKKEKTAVSGVEIKLDTPKNAEAVKVEFSKKAVDTLAKSSIGSVSVDSELAAVSMDKKAIESVSKQSRSGIEVSVEKANTKLNEKQKAAVGEAPVYDITVKSGGKQITTFDGGLITVTLPYTLKKGELPNRVVIWYVDDMGNIKKVDSMYDAKTQRVMFTTDHLSKYVISYEAWKNGFLDVKEDAWYYGAVKYVAEDAYYAEAVKWAASVGIVKGIDSRTFAPNAPLSREQAAMMIFSYARHKGVSLQEEGDLSKFSDYASVSKWALPAVKWASGNGIINGRTGMLLDPKGRATRAEIAKILMELMERTK